MVEPFAWSLYETEYGCGAAVQSKRGLHRILLPVYSALRVEAEIEERYGKVASRAKRLAACDLLESYFRGTEVDFSAFALDLEGYGTFERRVYEEAAKIPFGATISYDELAARAGYPGAARAVGNALRKNRLPIAVPCHRVIRANGGLGGWSGADGWKERLLEIEGIEISSGLRNFKREAKR